MKVVNDTVPVKIEKYNGKVVLMQNRLSLFVSELSPCIVKETSSSICNEVVAQGTQKLEMDAN